MSFRLGRSFSDFFADSTQAVRTEEEAQAAVAATPEYKLKR